MKAEVSNFIYDRDVVIYYAVCNPFNNTLFANYNKNEVFMDGNYLKISKDCDVYCDVIIQMTYQQNIPIYVVVHSRISNVSQGEILSDERVLELLKSKYHNVLVKSGCKIIRNFDHV